MQPLAKFDVTYYPTTAVSCAFFLCLGRYINPRLSAYLVMKFKKLTESKQAYWHSVMNSSIHAVIVSCLCVYAMEYEEELRKYPVWHESHVVKSSCAIMMGYMFADTILMTINYRHYWETTTLLHHVASVYACFYIITYGVYLYFANYRLLAEFSTVFVNNRWILDNLGYDKASRAYFWNGITMTAVFFACRVLTIPYCWNMIYSIYGTEAVLRTGNIKYVLLTSCFIFDTLNLYWFYKILKGAYKTLKRQKYANKITEAQKVQ